jgi:hypothetical protein
MYKIEKNSRNKKVASVWRIRDVYPGSRIRLFSIPDPNCLHPGSRILIKEFKYFNPKKAKKWFLSSKKYDPGCSSRIPDPNVDFLPSRIPDPGVKKAPNPGSRIRIPDPQHWVSYCTPNTFLQLAKGSLIAFRAIEKGYQTSFRPYSTCAIRDLHVI